MDYKRKLLDSAGLTAMVLILSTFIGMKTFFIVLMISSFIVYWRWNMYKFNK